MLRYLKAAGAPLRSAGKPFSCPNSSLSISVSGKAQLMAMNGPCRRELSA
jgi:hypothetical protein